MTKFDFLQRDSESAVKMSPENKGDVDEKSFINADKKKISCKYWVPNLSGDNEKPR